MSMSSGCLLEPATGFAGSSTIMALLLGFVCTFAVSDNWSRNVYCSKVPDDGAVVDSTALTGHGRGRVTCLAAACLAASFHALPVMAFSDRLLANGLITSVMHSEVSLAFLLSQWRTFYPHPSLHSIQDMWLGLSTTYSHHCCLAIYTDCRSVYHMFWEHWTSPRTWFWRHKPCLLVLPFSTTARILHLVDLECYQVLPDCWRTHILIH